MAYTPSLREIPLDQEPHASALAAVQDEDGSIDWDAASADQLAHLNACPDCKIVLGGADLQVGDGVVAGEVTVAAASNLRENMVNLMNNHRGSGKPKLSINSALNQGATKFAQQLGSRNSWIYNDGRSCGAGGGKHTRRYNNKGFCWHADHYCPQALAENMLYGKGTTAQSMFNAFKNSPDHNAIMLNRSYRKVGIGIYDSNNMGRICICLFA